MAYLSKTIDEVRAQETKVLKEKVLFSSGIVEGFNNKAKLTTSKTYGFRVFYAAQIELYHSLGALPVPKTTHKFF